MMDSPQWRVLNMLAHMLDHAQRVLVDEPELAEVREHVDELAVGRRGLAGRLRALLLAAPTADGRLGHPVLARGCTGAESRMAPSRSTPTRSEPSRVSGLARRKMSASSDTRQPRTTDGCNRPCIYLYCPRMAAPIQTADTEPVAPASTAEVREAQLRLQTQQPGLQTDGVAGPETQAVIERFQADHGLPTDGILGPQTLAMIRDRCPLDEQLLDVRAFRGEVRGVVSTPTDQLVVGTAAGELYRFIGDPPNTPSKIRSGRINAPIYRLGLSPNGKRVAIGTTDGRVVQVDEFMKVVGSFELAASKTDIFWSRYSSSGALACAWGADRVAVFRPGDDFAPNYLACQPGTTNLAWLSDDELIVSTNFSLAIISSTEKSIPKSASAPSGQDMLRWLEVSHSGEVLATRGRDPQIEIWNARTLEHRASINGSGSTSDASALAFSPEDGILAVGRADGWLELLDTQSWQVLARWRAHSQRITSIAFAPGEQWLATGSADTTAKRWRSPAKGVADGSIAILDSDSAHGVDALEIRRDVRALSRVMLAKDLRPPLSIGIFGDWGAGKSFFINKLHEQIERDAQLAREANNRECAWYGHVIQITFNAWHYVETNLWAALVTHLFDELGRRIDPQVPERTTRARLMSELDTARNAKSEAAEWEAAAQTRLAQAKREVEVAARRVAEVRDDQAWIESSDLLRLAANRFQRRLPETAKGGGEPSSDQLTLLEQMWREQTEALATWTGRLRLHFTRPRAWLLLLATVGLGIGTWVLWSRQLWPEWTSWSALTGTIGALLAWLGDAGKTAASNLDGVLARLRDVHARSKKLDQELNETRQSRVAAALRPLETARHSAHAALEAARADHERALRAAEQAERAVTEAEQAVAEASSGRVLFRFLTERAGSPDYRQHLGIISLIRADLVRLAALVGASKSEQPSVKSSSPVARVERIVLYIDDLDRCSPDRVVDVLQAIHLLLGVPDLFVVVVAVDSRWLIRSLANYYDRLLGPKDSIRESTPLDYLEKIFQIPYVVEQMDEVGYASMIRSLLRSKLRPLPPTPSPTLQSVEAEPGVDDHVKRKPTTQTIAPGPEPSTAEVQKSSVEPQVADDRVELDSGDLSPRELTISKDEQEFMEHVGPLIATPRLAKAFVNVYRLLRARMEHPVRDEPTLEKYLAGQHYRVALVILAMQIGHPEHAHELLRELQTTAPETTLDDYLARQTKSEQNGDPERQRILAFLVALRAGGYLPNKVSTYVAWAERVRRFSFQPWRR